MNDETGAAAPPVQLWTRDGFLGALSVVTRSTYAPDYLSVEGPHAPRRAVLERLTPDDASDPQALPTTVATSRLGVKLHVSGRRQPMPFVVRNVEADEIHFIQSGTVKFETDVGSLIAEEGDFVCIPRAIAYRYAPQGDAMRSVIVESPAAVKLTPPAPSGMINTARDVKYAQIDPDIPAGGQTRLILRTLDGENTVFVMPHDPLSLGVRLSDSVPVWKLNLTKIQTHSYLPEGGPPSHFLSSNTGELLMFNLSARLGNRPPIHINADFDEVVCYVRGPGAWGGCKEPGTLTWVPKGVIHHGPSEDVPQGYEAWLLETRATLRWTPKALAVSQLMETGNYEPHPGAGQ
ncbi:homogentisate 1,2-dioxygenase [Paraburkholderia sp. CNPSo 3155]|uniref:Homogentisate 1,2-dioxygenase n=1 Tax=Paraburkholderia atlantica TaxID=2654982 RepID=A0A6I1Q2V2_PARAM|nr:homogentisate 1,2-dioxygenase [Paraburkholderia atlantica]MBB5423133.1 homogentisate 1,2-dioxygenase [Paraburkholderia atlantica]MPW08648.1 homogentisate 1,2-dioxygenase [Paraburkholderia atlantica]